MIRIKIKLDEHGEGKILKYNEGLDFSLLLQKIASKFGISNGIHDLKLYLGEDYVVENTDEIDYGDELILRCIGTPHFISVINSVEAHNNDAENSGLTNSLVKVEDIANSPPPPPPPLMEKKETVGSPVDPSTTNKTLDLNSNANPHLKPGNANQRYSLRGSTVTPTSSPPSHTLGRSKRRIKMTRRYSPSNTPKFSCRTGHGFLCPRCYEPMSYDETDGCGQCGLMCMYASGEGVVTTVGRGEAMVGCRNGSGIIGGDLTNGSKVKGRKSKSNGKEEQDTSITRKKKKRVTHNLMKFPN